MATQPEALSRLMHIGPQILAIAHGPSIRSQEVNEMWRLRCLKEAVVITQHHSQPASSGKCGFNYYSRDAVMDAFTKGSLIRIGEYDIQPRRILLLGKFGPNALTDKDCFDIVLLSSDGTISQHSFVLK